jgi:hypothetical protein
MIISTNRICLLLQRAPCPGPAERLFGRAAIEPDERPDEGWQRHGAPETLLESGTALDDIGFIDEAFQLAQVHAFQMLSTWVLIVPVIMCGEPLVNR